MPPTETDLKIAQHLEEIARGIRNGTIHAPYYGWTKPEQNVKQFLSDPYEPDTDIEGEPYTEQEVEEMRQINLEYMSMYHGLILFYDMQKPKKRK